MAADRVSHLDFESGVIAQNDEFKCSLQFFLLNVKTWPRNPTNYTLHHSPFWLLQSHSSSLLYNGRRASKQTFTLSASTLLSFPLLTTTISYLQFTIQWTSSLKADVYPERILVERAADPSPPFFQSECCVQPPAHDMLGGAPAAGTLVTVLKPRAKLKVAVHFKPKDELPRSSLILIRWVRSQPRH